MCTKTMLMHVTASNYSSTTQDVSFSFIRILSAMPKIKLIKYNEILPLRGQSELQAHIQAFQHHPT